MRHLLPAAAMLATVLGLGVGNVEAASFALDNLANPGVQTVDVRYYRRYPPYLLPSVGRSVVYRRSLLQPRRDS